MLTAAVSMTPEKSVSCTGPLMKAASFAPRKAPAMANRPNSNATRRFTLPALHWLTDPTRLTEYQPPTLVPGRPVDVAADGMLVAVATTAGTSAKKHC